MRRALLPAVAWLLMLCTADAHGELDRFRFDSVHSRISFKVSHLGFTDSTGWFPAFEGELLFDQDNWAASSVRVEIDVNRLQMGDDGWNRKLLGRAFFNAKRFPSMRFESTRFERIDAHSGRLTGMLTLLGHSAPVSLDVRFNRRAMHKYSLRDTVGFSAQGTLSRAAFGMDSMRGDIGDQVSIELQIEAQHQRERPNRAPGR